jgi:hypothetical protein
MTKNSLKNFDEVYLETVLIGRWLKRLPDQDSVEARRLSAIHSQLWHAILDILNSESMPLWRKDLEHDLKKHLKACQRQLEYCDPPLRDGVPRPYDPF